MILNLNFKIFKAISPYVTHFQDDMGKYDAWWGYKHEVYSECPIDLRYQKILNLRFIFRASTTWFLKENKRFFRDVSIRFITDERIDILTKLVKSTKLGRFERLILHLTLTKWESKLRLNIRPYNDLFDEFEISRRQAGNMERKHIAEEIHFDCKSC